MMPEFVNESQISEEVKTKYIEAFRDEAAKSGKPANIQAKIAEGKWAEFLAGSCLMNQQFLKDDSKKISAVAPTLYARRMLSFLGKYTQ